MSLPVPQPAYAFRGHVSQIHAIAFIRGNQRLLTGDADGWVVLWDTVTRRPTAVWQAHVGSLLGLGAWGTDRIITHGKDNKLVVWKLGADEEVTMSTVLPAESTPTRRQNPWVLYTLDVNTMNFCSYAQCCARHDEGSETTDELLIAVPNVLTSETVSTSFDGKLNSDAQVRLIYSICRALDVSTRSPMRTNSRGVW